MVVAVVLLVLAAVASVLLAVVAQRRAARAGARLHELAVHDPLTGLVTAREVVADLDPRRRGTTTPALIALMMDRFGLVNATYGPETGDALLVAMATHLERGLQPGERLARLDSGPSFLVVLPDSTTQDALDRARQLRAGLEVPFRIAHDQIRLSGRAGVAVGDRATTPEALLADAVLACQFAAEEPDRVLAYLPSLRDRLTPGDAEVRLRRAVEQDQFCVYYQPVVDLADHHIVGVEALLRWVDPERGMVAPADFLADLSDSGLIVPLGWWMLEEVCRQARQWQDQFPDQHVLTSVNLSARQVDQDDLAERVLELVQRTGVDADRLCLEVVEAGTGHDVDAAWSVLRPAADAGIQLALDDFGSGYSSFRYLRRCRFDVLKIDQSLTAQLGQSRADDAILEQILNLAGALEIAAVAKGVATQDQATHLQGLRCPYAQGWLFGEPAPPETVTKLLATGRVTPGQASSRSIDWSGGG